METTTTITSDKTRKRKFIVAGLDGNNRVVDIYERREVEVRNHLHLRGITTEVEAERNRKINDLKALCVASVKCFVVSTWDKVKVDEEAAAVNAMMKRRMDKQRDNTQKYLAQLKVKTAHKAAQKARDKANAKAIVKWAPRCTAIVKVS